MKKLLWLFFAMVMINLCSAYKILVIFPFPSKSHSILGDNLVKPLLQAGHEVTYITPFPIKYPHKNLKQVDVRENIEVMKGSPLNIKTILDNKITFTNPILKFILTSSLFDKTIKNPNVTKLFSDISQKFDAVIVEFFFNDLFSGLATLYDCPFIWLSTVEPNWNILSLIDEATNPSYVPDIMSNVVPPFSFKERASELFVQLVGSAFDIFYWNGYNKQEFEKSIGPFLTMRGKSIPVFDDVKYNVSLVLGNSHVSLGQATRLPQNYIPIAGYHIDPDVKPLPEDLKKIIDNAKNGLIYFSMGSNLKSKDLPDNTKKSILKMFGELKQTVLWKFEEVIPDLPENVHIVQWAPQHSVLAHRNCVLFITHGGLLSTTESIHFGKPIIGIPVFGDQFTNIERAVKKGFAKKVTLSYTMADELKTAIDEVLGDPKYMNKAKEFSIVYHDRPVSPANELVHWVEHVVKTRGAPHLRSPALHVPFYQKCYLDLLALIVTVIVAIVVILKRALKSIKNKNITKKKNK
ncbi:UDP-glycosyltransferase UGT5-like [Aphomia sociella]